MLVIAPTEERKASGPMMDVAVVHQLSRIVLMMCFWRFEGNVEARCFADFRRALLQL